MLRNPVSEFSLFGGGKVREPRPSFQPAVEALEERVVLSASYSTAAGAAYNQLHNGLVMAYYNYLTHETADTYQGLVSAANAATFARYAYEYHNLSWWYTAHTYADDANMHESRDNHTSPNKYAFSAEIWEYYGSNNAYNASLGLG
jgi:hypothetical protein